MCQFKSYYRQLFSTKILVVYLLTITRVCAVELASIEPTAGLFYQDENGVKNSAPLLSSFAEMHVNGLINRVTVTQVFKNNSNNWIDATYLFPLPENAAVDHLTMTVAERVIIGEIKEKSEAQQIFSQAKQAGKKATLIKQQRNNIFISAVANIAPGEDIQVEIEYQQGIDYQAGVFSLRYPMTITPRYAPATANLTTAQRNEYLACLTMESSEEQASLCQKRWDNWLQGVGDQKLAAQTLAQVKDNGDPDLQMEIKVYLHSPLAIKNISSPYHPINVETLNESTQKISLQGEKVIADRDFVLNWQLPQSEQSESVMFVQAYKGEKYGAVMLLPPAEPFIEAARIDKEVIFVIDVSGSMSGKSIQQAKSALSFAVDKLGENDTFNIIAFSDNSEFFADNSLPIDKRSQVMAKVFIEQLQATGGTNMQSAIAAALTGKRTIHSSKKQGVRQVVFITDASISNEQQLLTQINEQLGDSRLFMVGIGSAPNQYFMKSTAIMGKGTYTNIAEINEVKDKMSILFEQLATPVLRDIALTWGDGSTLDYWPKPAKDLYQGEPLQLVFKIPQGKTSVHISGVRFVANSSQPWAQDIKVTEQKNAQGIAVLWAKTQIDSVDLNRDLSNLQKRQKITELGLTFHIVSEYTSLVAVQPEVSRPAGLDSISEQIKRHIPQGSSMRLPQTGTASELYKHLGILVLLLAGVLWVCELNYQQSKPTI